MKSAGDPTYMIEQYKSRYTENLFNSEQINDFLEKSLNTLSNYFAAGAFSSAWASVTIVDHSF